MDNRIPEGWKPLQMVGKVPGGWKDEEHEELKEMTQESQMHPLGVLCRAEDISKIRQNINSE